MVTIKIRTFGEKVYFLNSEGFQKGKIKRSMVVSERKGYPDIKYMVVSDTDNPEYGGSEKKEGDLFDSWEEMINHYAELNS